MAGTFVHFCLLVFLPNHIVLFHFKKFPQMMRKADSLMCFLYINSIHLKSSVVGVFTDE